MATIKSTPVEAQFFQATDPYRFDVDNRPLEHLLNNDVAINAELEAVRDEVVQARTGLVSTYPSLDHRLDALEDSIGASVSISSVEDLQGHQYGDFISNAEAIRRATPSGFLDHNGIADLGLGDAYDDFGAIRTSSTLFDGYQNSFLLWAAWGSAYRPIRSVVNGWIVRLFNEKAGTPTTEPPNHVSIHLGSAPNTGKYTNFAFLEVWLEEVDSESPTFYKYGAVNTLADPPTVDDHLHPEVIHTVKAMAVGGNWIQLRHRIRVIQNVDPAAAPYGYSASVEAQGAQGAPVGGYAFTNMFSEIDDAGLWRAGAGDQTSKDDLGTYDGYVYSIPIALVHRRNSDSYRINNQNGARLEGSADSGYHNSGVSGRPDGLYYDMIDQRDVLDLRHKISLSGVDLASIQQQTWQLLIRGELRTNWKELRYDYNNDDTWEGASVWGHTLTVVDEIGASANAGTNPMRDRAVSTQPVSQPDGIRVFWSKTPTLQPVKFTFKQGDPALTTPANLVTYNPASETLTFNAAALPSAGTGGVKVGSNPPLIMKVDDLSSQPAFRVSGLGTQTAAITLTGANLVAAATYVGVIYLIYPGGSGLEYPFKRILSHEVDDQGITTYKSQQYGVTGNPSDSPGYLSNPISVSRMSDGTLVVCDQANHRILTMDPTDLSVTGQFGVTGEAGVDDAHLDSPTGVGVNTVDDSIFISDTGNERIVKLNSSLVKQTEFGEPGVSGADNSHTNRPLHLVVGDYVYVADSLNHRVLRLSTNLAYVSQFGTTGTPSSTTLGLNSPTGVAITLSGFGPSIWITDTGNRRVVVLDASMTFQYQIRAEGSGRTLNQEGPTDVAIDATGNIYMSFGDYHVIQKYSPEYILLAQFGTYGQSGSTNLTLDHPSGLAIDDTRGWIYCADAFNHRVIRLTLANLSYVSQFGVTKNTSVPLANRCGTPSDVALDDNGDLYIAENSGHCVTKVLRTNISTATDRFCTVWGQSHPDTSTGGLKNPMGIAVKKSDGSVVVVADAGNNRVVVLNGTLDYVRHFTPTYNISVLNRVCNNVWDVEYSLEGGNDRWYVTGYERPPSVPNNAWNLMTPVVWRFATAPPSPGVNYQERIEVEYGPTGIYVGASTFWITSRYRGLGVFNLSDYNDFIWTGDRTTTIIFPFTRPTGISASSTCVLVAEPDLHCFYVFDPLSGLFLSSVGTPFEAGDDDAGLHAPEHSNVSGDSLVVCDTKNHRILRRHISSPWVSSSGTITTGVAPAATPSADRVRIFYETEAYQGFLNALGGGESIWKSQVRYESPTLVATTMGLGNPMTAISSEYKSLKGLTARLPLPTGWTDYRISPVGLKVGTADSEDDGPYLSLPVTISEGLRGGQTSISQEAETPMTSKRATQQVCKTVAGVDTPKRRGLRSVLARDQKTSVANTLNQFEGAQGTSPVFVPEGGRAILDPVPLDVDNIVRGALRGTDTRVTNLRYGVPPIKSYNLLEAIPHFTYYSFLYQRAGHLAMAVLSEAGNSKTVGVGGYESNAVDAFFPQGRILVR